LHEKCGEEFQDKLYMQTAVIRALMTSPTFLNTLVSSCHGKL